MVGRTAPKLKERRRVGFGGIPLDTPPLAAGSFIADEGVLRVFQESSLPLNEGATKDGNKNQ